jgi:hypothetical protein
MENRTGLQPVKASLKGWVLEALHCGSLLMPEGVGADPTCRPFGRLSLSRRARLPVPPTLYGFGDSREFRNPDLLLVRKPLCP